MISDAQKIVFCHIPKNGGSSLRRHLVDLWPDTRQHMMVAPVDALGGARRDLTHITVAEAEAWLGERLIDGGYSIVVVVRPALPRLRSALYHYLRVMHPDERDFIPTDKAIAFLRNTSLRDVCARAAEDPECIHFRRQVDFIEGVPEAQRDLVPIERLAERFPDVPHVNRAGRLPGWLRMFDTPATRGLVRAMGTQVRRGLRRTLTRRDTEVERFISEMVHRDQAFVQDHYAPDDALHRQALGAP